MSALSRALAPWLGGAMTRRPDAAEPRRARGASRLRLRAGAHVCMRYGCNRIVAVDLHRAAALGPTVPVGPAGPRLQSAGSRKSAIVFGVTTLALSTCSPCSSAAGSGAVFGSLVVRLSRRCAPTACSSRRGLPRAADAVRLHGRRSVVRLVYGSVSHSFALLYVRALPVMVAIVLPPGV